MLSSVSFGYSGGSGTAEDPYQIADANDLLALAADTNDYGRCFILTADINMEGQLFTTALIAPDTSSDDFFQGSAFTGTFDGSGHRISYFTMNSGSDNFFLGLFGFIDSGGVIENLGLENLGVSGPDYSEYVGGLAGDLYGGGGSVVFSFWDTQTSGQTTSAGGTGKTTAEMRTLLTFTSAGWDFVDVWGIGNGQTYPYLKPFNRVNPADLNYSGTVDMQDFAILAANWLEED